MRCSLLLAAALPLAALAASPVPGFRPPAVPLFTQSPLINVWSTADALNGAVPTHWTGNAIEMAAMARVDGAPFLLMGDASASGAPPAATQLSVSVMATQTHYSFQAGAVRVDLTFASPLITSDYDLLSRPAHYVTFTATSTDGAAHAVQLYFDCTGELVVHDKAALVSWARTPVTGPGIARPVTAVSIGATSQQPLRDTNDRAGWGILYVMADSGDAAGGGATLALEYSNTTRALFASTGALPAADNQNQPAPLFPQTGMLPPTGPQAGVDRSGGDMAGSPFTLASADPNLCWAACNTTAGCVAWAYAVPGCDQFAQPTCWLKSEDGATSNNKCRVSGAQAHTENAGPPLAAAAAFDLGSVPASGAAVSRHLTLAVDEILSIMWFGEPCPPYWRRNMALNDSTTVPLSMLASAHSSYAAVVSVVDAFDAKAARDLSGVGGDEYATLAQLVYRQVFGAAALFWVPSKQTAWYMAKEISSCGCLNTADVIYPMFPIVLYYAPELMRLMMVTHLEYAMNYTNQPYPYAWAPHHLGYWPLADLPYQNQENMPLEETSWNLLIIAAIAQRQGGDLSWLAPYWPAMETWYSFMAGLLPFPQEQLSTDDFDGPLYNATNLAVKGVAGVAAYGYIVQQYLGDSARAAQIYAQAASFASTMVDFSWNPNASDPSQAHFIIGYFGSQSDGGVPTSWPMLYNALWLRIFGYTALLPNQAYYLNTMRDWYSNNVMNEYGIPLNSRKSYTKDDWMTFLAGWSDPSRSPTRPDQPTLTFLTRPPHPPPHSHLLRHRDAAAPVRVLGAAAHAPLQLGQRDHGPDPLLGLDQHRLPDCGRLPGAARHGRPLRADARRAGPAAGPRPRRGRCECRLPPGARSHRGGEGRGGCLSASGRRSPGMLKEAIP